MPPLHYFTMRAALPPTHAGKVMVVDGQHIKRNQAEAMQRISQNEEKVLFLPADDNRDAELRGLLAVEKMTASPTADPPVGRLAYHTACVQLLVSGPG